MCNTTRVITCPNNSFGWTPQLEDPVHFKQYGQRMFPNCRLYSLVAWDHVSWPGNDFYTMGRYTDDGVKTAATNAMTAITDHPGTYDEKSFKYRPDSTGEDSYKNWLQVVQRNELKLYVKDNTLIL